MCKAGGSSSCVRSLRTTTGYCGTHGVTSTTTPHPPITFRTLPLSSGNHTLFQFKKHEWGPQLMVSTDYMTLNLLPHLFLHFLLWKAESRAPKVLAHRSMEMQLSTRITAFTAASFILLSFFFIR